VNDMSRTFGTGQAITADALAPIAPEQQLAYALGQTQVASMLPPDIGIREIGQYFAVFKASLRAMQNYRRHPYAGRVTLFRAGDRPLDEAGPTLGWEGLPADGVELRVVPGDHYTFIRQPHVAALAEQLSACLDEAQTVSEVHT
jgi:thioesterase domain-containing protein